MSERMDTVHRVRGADVDVSIDRKRWWLSIAWITGLGAGLRTLVVLFVTRADGPLGDQLFYSAQAFSNMRGDWFQQPFASGMPAADHPPLTALVLTPITWLLNSTGSAVDAQRLFMTVIGSISIVLMGLIGRELGGSRVGLITAGTTAVYANVWINDALIMADTPTFALVAALTFVALRHVEKPSRARVIWIGVLGGLCALTRPELVALIFLGALLVYTVHRVDVSRRVRMCRAGAVVACGLMVIAPWVVWNQTRFSEPVFLSTNDGLTLAGANCDTTYYHDLGGWDIWCAYETSIPPGSDASRACDLMRHDALEYMTENVDRLPVVIGARLLRVTSLGFIRASANAAVAEGRPTWVSYMGVVQFWSMLPFVVLGCRRRTTREVRWILLGAVPIVVGVALIAHAYVRFRVPAEVGLIALFALGYDTSSRRIVDWWRIRGERATSN